MDVAEVDHSYSVYDGLTFDFTCPHCGERVELRDTNSGARCCRTWRLAAVSDEEGDDDE